MNLRAKLEQLAGRGNPRSTSDVWTAAISAGAPTNPERSRLLPAGPAGAFAVGFATVAVVAVVSIAVFNLGSGGQPAGSDSTSTSTSTTEPEPEPETLSIEFINWMFPVEAVGYSGLVEKFSWPFTQARIDEAASCLQSFGFDDLADSMIGDPPPPLGAGWNLFWMPKPANRDGLPFQHWGFELLQMAFEPSEHGDGEDHRDFWVGELGKVVSKNPRFGVAPEDVESLHDAILECKDAMQRPLPSVLERADSMQFDWQMRGARAIDEDASVQAALNGVVTCLVENGRGFYDGLDDAENATGRFDSFGQIRPDDQEAVNEMHRLIDVHYDCMRPVTDARLPLRLAAREQLVQENYDRLLQLQADLQRALDQLAG